jgi:hypothetical protein
LGTFNAFYHMTPEDFEALFSSLETKPVDPRSGTPNHKPCTVVT